jgi:lysophospholipase L1-like esterase
MNDSVAGVQENRSRAKAAGGRRDLYIGLMTSAVMLLLCLGALELAGYVWERRTAQGSNGWSLVAARRLHFERHGGAGQVYYLFEPGRDYVWRGIPVAINSRGLRDEEFAVPKPADTYRILNVGDSIAFGWEVHLEETYGKRLEASLNSRGDGRRYEVINAAIPTWNLEAERNYLLQEALGYEPDLVILDVTIVNDIRGPGPEAMHQNRRLTGWLRDHTYGWPFLATNVRFVLARHYGPEAIAVLNPPTEVTKYYPLERDHPAWDKVWQPLAEMYQASSERGIPFIVVAFPTAYQLSSLAHPDVPQQVLGERAEAAGIPFIDLLPIYAQVCREAGAGACEGYQNLLFADVWMHPNELGHQLAAQEIEALWESTWPND